MGSKAEGETRTEDLFFFFKLHKMEGAVKNTKKRKRNAQTAVVAVFEATKQIDIVIPILKSQSY